MEEWDWFKISKAINIKEVWKYPDMPWRRDGLSCNSNITMELIDYNNFPNATGEWSWEELSIYMSISIIVTHRDRPWNKIYMSYNPGITMDIIDLDFPNATGDWNWTALSSTLDINTIIKNSDRPWVKDGISSNRGITIDIINSLYHLPGRWLWTNISSSISISEVFKYPHLPWSRNGLSYNNDITKDVMHKLDLEMINPKGEWKIDVEEADINYITNTPFGNIKDLYKKRDSNHYTYETKYLSIPNIFAVDDLIIPHKPQGIKMFGYTDLDFHYTK